MSFTGENSKRILVADGVATVFGYNFMIYASSHLAVYLDGVLQSSGYTVSGVGDAAGGNVTFTAAPAANVIVTLNLEVPFTQELDYTVAGKFPATSHEQGLDLITMLCKRLKEVDERALLVPLGGNTTEDMALPTQANRASKYLAFDTDGNPVATAGTTSDLVASTFIETLLDDADADAARTTLVAAKSGIVTGTGITQTTGKLLGRTTAATGAVEEITPGNGLTFSAGSLSADSASTTVDGIVELATQAEVDAMTDTTRVITVNHNKIILGTPVAATSGTSIDFTSIPAGTRKITILFVGVSTSGTSNPLIQIGDAGGVETSGYLGAGWQFNVAAVTNYTAGFGIPFAAAAAVFHGTLTLYLQSSSAFTWVASGATARSDGQDMSVIAGSKSLSAALDRVRITTVGGTDTFDAGSINVQYER